MKNIIVASDFYVLPKVCGPGDNVYFHVSVSTEQRKKFFNKRYLGLKQHLNECNLIIGEGPLDSLYLGPRAWIEINKYPNFYDQGQNRLFKELPFPIGNNFTSFRKRAEHLLPVAFENAIKPFDKEVLSEIDYYFYQTTLPLTYFQERNGLVGRDYSSKMSAFLSCGALDVRYLYNEVKSFEKRVGANKSTYWLVFELLWREFFFWHYQVHQRKYFSLKGLKGELCFTNFKKYEIHELRNLSQSQFFTAALNELERTGFLSNRVRQMFASFWINDLELDWRSGAQLFEDYLIDYDVFSNYGNWMYLAGVGVDPRGKRYFNIQKQLSMYDPNGHYIKKWY